MRARIRQVIACVIATSAAFLAESSAQTAGSDHPLASVEWANDVTTLVIAPDGTWGAATDLQVDRALAKAIAQCKSKYRYEIGCGYRSTSVRAGWITVLQCDQEYIITTAKTLHAAEQAAADSELNSKPGNRPDIRPCIRVVSVDPDGQIIAHDSVQLLRSTTDRTR